MTLKIEYLPVEELTPYAGNAKMHPAEQIEQIKESIKQFGFNDPVAVWGEDNTIVEGHGRLIAALEMGIDKIPIIRLDNLTDEQRKAYTLAHNKLTMNSDFDINILRLELEDIADIDMGVFGFSDLEEEDEKKVKPEVPFTEVIGEESNYLILKFKTDIDWLNAMSLFGIGSVKAYSTRKDGKVTEKMQRIGTARVLDGAEALHKLLGDI